MIRLDPLRAARRLLDRLTIFAADRQGSIAVMGAAVASVSLILCGVVVDGGHLYLVKLNQQSVTDLAAITAARNMLSASPAAIATVRINKLTPSVPLTVTTGRYQENAAVAVGQRFVAGGVPANAVRVVMSSNTPLYFGSVAIGRSQATIQTAAMAAVSQTAAFSIGSRLASLNGGVANSVLGAMLGGSVNLTAMDYNSLLSSQVNMLGFMNALATEARITAGTYTTLGQANVTMGNIVGAMVGSGMTGPNASTAAQALGKVVAQPAIAGTMISAGKLVSLGDYANLSLGGGSALAANVTAYQLLSASAQAANGTNQLALNLGFAVPGLAGLSATVAIGQPPQGTSWITVGSTGATVYTAQTRIMFQASVLGTGILNAKLLSVPILIDVASGRATMNALSCGSNPSIDGTVGLAVRPSVAESWIGRPHTPTSWWSFAAAPTVDPAQFVSVPLLLTATGNAHLAASNTSDTAVSFSFGDVQAKVIKTVSTQNPTSTLLASLFGNLNVSVTALGLIPIGTSGATTLVKNLVQPVGALVDPVLIGTLDTLGIKIGQVDVTVNGLRCDGAVLVQ